MTTRDISTLVLEIRNNLVDSIYRKAKELQEEEIEIGITICHEHYKTLQVEFPYDDEEFESVEDYLDEMSIVAVSEYYDADGCTYENETDLVALNLSALIEIYNTICK